jgi:glycosyltransferase involved in cell wall biosynthesis
VRVLFIIPCFNASKNIPNIISSLTSQTDDRWNCVIVDDISTDNTFEVVKSIKSKKFAIIKNDEKKYALRNIVDTARLYENREDIVVAVIDGDDQLCNDNAVSLLLDEYQRDFDVVWTAHKWDINGMNISKEIPSNVDPYSWPWCSSHLRTFRSSLIKNVSDKNFKDCDGNWFKRGYDQALMLPLLSLTNNRKYIPEVCYQYNINSVSIENRSWEEKEQISTINIVRARGFLK